MAVHDRGELGERIAKLETEMETLLKNQEKQEEILERISNELTKYKGFIGGIMFIVSAVFAFLKTAPYISSLFNK